VLLIGGIGFVPALPCTAQTSMLLSALYGNTICGLETVVDQEIKANPPAAVELSWHPLIAHEILKSG